MRFGKNRNGVPLPPLDLSEVSVSPLTNDHVVNAFACGRKVIDEFLKRKALRCADRCELAVFAATMPQSRICLGYYALQVGSDTVPESREHKKSYLGAGEYSAFPAVELKFLGVDETYQGQGLGKYLLMDAMDRVYDITQNAGLYAMTLQPLDPEATAFYERAGFERYAEATGREPKLMYTIGTMRKMREQAGR